MQDPQEAVLAEDYAVQTAVSQGTQDKQKTFILLLLDEEDHFCLLVSEYFFGACADMVSGLSTL